MYGRRPNKKQKLSVHRSQRSIIMMTYGPNNVTSKANALQMVPLPTRTSEGWQIYDVTRSISIIVQETENTMRAMMAVDFFWTRDKETYVDWSNKKTIRRHSLLRHYSSIALVVFSNDTQNITLDHLNPHLASKDKDHGVIIDPETGQPIEKLDYVSRYHKNKYDFTAEVPIKMEDSNSENTWSIRKRSIYDNEIPENPGERLAPSSELLTTYNIPHPNSLKSKTALKQRKYKHLQLKERNTATSRLLPHPDEYTRKHGKGYGRRKHRKRMPRQRADNRILSDKWNLSNDAQLETEGCSRRRFRIDFADIGWSDWIISPKSFDAHYCSGSCHFDITKVIFLLNF